MSNKKKENKLNNLNVHLKSNLNLIIHHELLSNIIIIFIFNINLKG